MALHPDMWALHPERRQSQSHKLHCTFLAGIAPRRMHDPHRWALHPDKWVYPGTWELYPYMCALHPHRWALHPYKWALRPGTRTCIRVILDIHSGYYARRHCDYTQKRWALHPWKWALHPCKWAKTLICSANLWMKTLIFKQISGRGCPEEPGRPLTSKISTCARRWP